MNSYRYHSLEPPNQQHRNLTPPRSRMLLVVMCTALAGLSFTNHAAAYQPGDKVVVVAHANLRTNRGYNSAKVFPGLVLKVAAVDGDRLWLTYEHSGWLNRRHVVPLGHEAIQHLSAMIRSNPSSAKLYNGRATIWMELGELDIAIADYGEALRLAPQASLYSNRAIAWKTKGNNDKAIADFNQALRLNPRDSTALNARGNAWMAKGNVDKAIADYEEALRWDPRNILAYNGRGVGHLKKDEFDRAIADFNQALELDSNYALAYANRGDAHRRKGDYDRAIADLTKAIQIDPKHDLAYNRRALAWKSKRVYRQAISDLRASISINPSHTGKHYELAVLLATCPDDACRDGSTAVRHAKKACDLTDWKNTYCIEALAAAYAESGDFDQAIHWQQKARSLASTRKSADFQQRLDLYRSGKPYRQS